MKVGKFVSTVILMAILLATAARAEMTLGDMSKAVIDALGPDMVIECERSQFSVLIWYNAGEQRAKEVGDISKGGEYKKVPNADGWMVEIDDYHDEISRSLWAAIYGSSSKTWNELWNIDGKKTSLLKATRFIITDGYKAGYGLTLTCGKDCNRDIEKNFLSFTLPAPARPVVGDSLWLDGDMGFKGVNYLFNGDQWAGLKKRWDYTCQDRLAMGLEHPIQVVLIYRDRRYPSNEISLDWSAMLKNAGLDLKQNVFRRSLPLVREWPAYQWPAYVFAVHSRDGNWALIANMKDYYFIENNGVTGVVKRNPKGL
jgi:hypothetical protein